jgi:hypothetical protein
MANAVLDQLVETVNHRFAAARIEGATRAEAVES